MKRTMKKLVSLVLALVISLTATVPAFAKKESYCGNKSEILKQAPDYYSEEYQREILETKQNVQDFLKNRMHTNSGEKKYLSVPLYKQENGYYCGPASVQMTLKYVTGKLYSQSSLANDMGTTRNSGTYVYRVAQELNNKAGRNTYRYVQTSDIGFASGLYYSVNKNKPVICHTFTKGLPNYGKNGCNHYLVSTGYTYDMAGYDNVRYNDPNNNDANFGTYDCPSLKMSEAINNRAGYYIMAT